MRGMMVADCNKLQVLQNTVNRILTGARVGTRTEDLPFETGAIFSASDDSINYPSLAF